jgi:hypothetical protein
MRTWQTLGCAALLLALAPLGMAQEQAADDSGYAGGTVAVTLHGHVYDLLDALPMTTQPMHPESPDLARGYSEPTIAPVYGAGFNKLLFFNSMGPVEYNASLGQPRIHPEKGLALDVELDPEQDILAYIWFSADFTEVRHANFQGPAPVGVVPMFNVQATLRLGNDVRKDLTQGEVVAQGQTVLDLVTPPGGAPQEVAINLGKAGLDRIPQRDSFNLQFEWWQVDSGGNRVLQPGWILHTGAQHPIRLVLPVKNPLYLYFVEPQFQEDKLAVNAAFITPLGNYDVDPASLEIEIAHANGFRAKTLSEPVLVQHTYQHNEHNVATLNGWLWDYLADEAPPGEYKVTVRGKNLQGTASAEKSATFVLSDEPESSVALDSEGNEVLTQEQLDALEAEAPKKTPGFHALLVLAIPLVVWLARRVR